MKDTIIQLLLENPRDVDEFSEFLIAAGYIVWNKDASAECNPESTLLMLVADATYEHTNVIDEVVDILNRNVRALVLFRMPRNPAAPTWGEQFGLRAGYIAKDSGPAEFLSYLTGFIRVSKLRFTT